MATLDNRLLPLIEALTTAGADWLAFEIIDGLRAGRVAEETRENLELAQIKVRSAKRERRAKRLSEAPAVPPPVADPIVGDEQIDWAATYVTTRMVDVLSMLEASLGQLDNILMSNARISRGTSDAFSGVELVLETGPHEQVSFNRESLVVARNTLPTLQEALLTWAASVRKAG